MISPGFWMNETTGVLRPAVEAYLNDQPMTPEQIAAFRAYLRQWITAPGWADTKILSALRVGVELLETREEIISWLDMAMHEGIDQL